MKEPKRNMLKILQRNINDTYMFTSISIAKITPKGRRQHHAKENYGCCKCLLIPRKIAVIRNEFY